MDTGTHLVIGLGLAGLSLVDPVVASDATTAAAVFIGVVLGSQAPDADGLLRMKGNAAYIKNHRGASHSLPAVLGWAIGLSVLLPLIFGPLPMAHLYGWVQLAVAFHVFTDLFNTYGTQAFRPFTDKWISWNIIHIFDPFIFVTHLIAIFMWAAHVVKPVYIFPVLYGIIAVYYVWRTIDHYELQRGLPRRDPFFEDGDQYYLLPTVNVNVWNIVKREADGAFRIGELRSRQITWVDRVKCDSHPAVEASKSHPDIASFLYFSSFACAEVKEHSWGYEVRWADVRYRHRKQYPFVAVLLMDFDLKPRDSYVGWLSDSRLEKKLGVDSY